MTIMSRAEFVDAYTRLLIEAWSSEDFAELVEDSPREALSSCGLLVPDDCEVTIVRGGGASDTPAETRLDSQVEDYIAGCQAGHVVLHVPAIPQIESESLDLAELDAISAGGISCCCCPCCCCT